MAFFRDVKCCNCGETFGMAEATWSTLQRNGHTFHCPWGHKQHFVDGPSEADKLRQERDRLKQDAARLEDEIRAEREWRKLAQNQARAFKGNVTRLKNRAAAGVCPCCNRSFENLRRHMQAKHKGFALEDTAPIGATVQ